MLLPSGENGVHALTPSPRTLACATLARHAVCHTLFSIRVHLMLIGACDSMLYPIHGFRQTLADAPGQKKVTRIEIPRITVKVGTTPTGSQWARIPIPSCKYSGAKSGWPGCTANDCASCCAKIAPLPAHPRINASWWRAMDCIAGCAGNGLPGSCPKGELQFPEPTPGMSSLWSSWLWCDAPRTAEDAAMLAALPEGRFGDSPHDMPCRTQPMIRTNIVDQVQLPADLVPGDYMISWRWDSEQTNQVWQNCADVAITA